MITLRLSIFLWLALVLYFLCILHLIKKGNLALKYSLMWLFSGIVILFIVLFPSTFNFLMEQIGIVNPSNGLFAICTFLILVMLLAVTSIISKMNNKIKTLTQLLGMAEKRIRDLEREREENKT